MFRKDFAVIVLHRAFVASSAGCGNTRSIYGTGSTILTEGDGRQTTSTVDVVLPYLVLHLTSGTLQITRKLIFPGCLCTFLHRAVGRSGWYWGTLIALVCIQILYYRLYASTAQGIRTETRRLFHWYQICCQERTVL